ncbi:putative sugar phosphate isomerase/epimerase [Indibacter alkaliphilus LW1]|jgi:sugar phosphate isomerase/epimerase|uniref:Sugar phosphate isomerase/epimerase n=1 Tax=Indibacter alkaliphilus (strain CCUG 57479 / KCTC 22604 / LW1) TaxID=1189612 RepID=S2DJ29_INDAL|nr:sugar phosphate isomerase/epimerase [Indibacter alkaliphilus]EOZ91961.1 putative sugar phosphate isomerase/epimerase [Indibacter alkaliphilus LW1]
MNNRRAFLKASGALAIGALLKPSDLFALRMAKKPIGLQLYSLRADMREDPQNTLRMVASIGYKTLETANYNEGLIYGMEPIFFRRYIEDLGLKMRSAHVGGPQFDGSNKEELMNWWKKAVSDHKATGAKYIIKPSMPIPTSLSELDKWCDYYNSIGEVAKKGGMMFGFHNHAREFEQIEGKIMLDYMIENTDEKLVFYELDVYWAQKGGQDPVDYLNKYPKRFPVLHIKDEEEIGASGTMDFKEIFETAYKHGMKDYFVEVERYNYEPLESVLKSFEYLNTASFVK